MVGDWGRDCKGKQCLSSELVASLVPRPRPALQYCKRRKAGRGLGTRLLVAVLLYMLSPVQATNELVLTHPTQPTEQA